MTPEALQAALPGRPLRSYAALVSTGSAAQAWAAGDAPDGAVVIADQQLSPRGHAGRPLVAPPDGGLGFAVVMRPALPAAREGWLYTVVLAALADALGERSTLEWPDEVRRDGTAVATAAVRTRVDEIGEQVLWAIVDVLLPGAAPPRGPTLRAVLEAIDARRAQSPGSVIREYARRCDTIGRDVRARLRAGTGPSVVGRAVATLDDGAIVLETANGSMAPVRPQDVRALERA